MAKACFFPKTKWGLLLVLTFGNWMSFAQGIEGERNEMVADKQFPMEAAARFAGLALACVHREYPNKIAHVMNGPEEVGVPSQLHPIFYGCFDWHSSVHGHWLMVRLLRLYPEAPFAEKLETALDKSFHPNSIKGEVDYFAVDGRASYERPYGLAWLLQLCAELREWQDPRARRWYQVLEPLEKVCADRFREWLPKLAYPIRTGEHSQTAFAFGLLFDWAVIADDQDMLNLVKRRSRDFYQNDRGCSLAFEPSGQDFLSACIAEADLMRRILDQNTFPVWLGRFMPEIPLKPEEAWLPVGIVTDATDGKLAHLDGLNLSRAWMLEGIASALPKNDPRTAALWAAAAAHSNAGLKAVTGAHYEGGHWLGSFAVYLVTGRGL